MHIAHQEKRMSQLSSHVAGFRQLIACPNRLAIAIAGPKFTRNEVTGAGTLDRNSSSVVGVVLDILQREGTFARVKVTPRFT